MINSFNLFGINIHFYSLCILLGVITAYFVVTLESKRHNIDRNRLNDLIFYTIIVGIIGARLYYVVFNISYYITNPIEIFMVWNGGLAIHGGIIAGLIFVYFYCKKYNMNYIKIIDMGVLGLIIAQAIGRWGNFFNQEAYGSLVSREVLEKILIPKFVIDGMNIDGDYYIPTFYIESIWCIIGFIIMLFISRKNIKEGTLTAFYLIWYGVGRLVIEIFRTDSLMLGGFKQAIIISIMFIVSGIIILFVKNRKKYKE